MKKFLVLLLTIVLSVVCFSGCGKNETYTINCNVVEITSEQTSSKDLKSVIKDVKSSVVEVYSTFSNGTGAGAGIVFGATDFGSTSESGRSLIITCHHVIENALSISIKTVDGTTYPATFIASDPDSDICVMSVEAELNPVTIIDSDTVDVGESVMAIGNPLGTLGGTVTSGIISATSREINVDGIKMNLMQTDAAINSGNSGGALFTHTGYLVGMVNAKYNSSYYSSIEGLGFAIPSKTIISVVTDLLNKGYIEGKYKLGCEFVDKYDFYYNNYVCASSLDTSGCFYKAGVRSGDIITSVVFNQNTYTPTNATSLSSYLSGLDLKIGDTITLTIKRMVSYQSYTTYTYNVEITQYKYELPNS